MKSLGLNRYAFSHRHGFGIAGRVRRIAAADRRAGRDTA
jgi:hypothetical protein